MATTVQHHQRSQVATASGLDTIAGIWLIISAFAINVVGTTNFFWNNVICGVIVTVLAASRFLGAYRQSWMSWLNAAVGVWVFLSPWFLGFSGRPSALWNNVITGIVIAALGVWSASASDADVSTTTMRSY